MRWTALCTTLALLALLICQCSDSRITNNDNPTPVPQYTMADLTATDHELLEAGSQFAPEIFRRICESREIDENVFVSPLSISVALGMVHAGAAGETQQAISQALRLPAGMTLDQVNESYRTIMKVLPGLDPRTTVSLANAVWYRQSLTLHGSFQTICRDYFDAAVRGMDFDDPATVDTINSWVDDKTRGLISEIVASPLPRDLVALLANAIYFKGDWTYSFDPDFTKPQVFHRADGSEVIRDMMYLDTDSLLDDNSRRDTTVLYASTQLFWAASLPYGNGALRMTVLSPTRDHTADDIIGAFTAESWAEWRGLLRPASFELALPKFRFEFEQPLKDQLVDMGMGPAFDPFVANFDSMFVDADVFISQALHKSFVQVDEVGTEAAAVTVIAMGTTSLEKQLIRCDRPFVFVIHESTTGTILFAGRVADPVWQ